MDPEEQPANPQQEALKKRVQLFSEGLVKMASPVLLVPTMMKAHLASVHTKCSSLPLILRNCPQLLNRLAVNSKGNRFVLGLISPLAAATLQGGIFLFVWLWLSSSERLLADEAKRIMHVLSKLLVYLCGMVLMALASDILLLISMDRILFLLVPITISIYIIPWCCWSMHWDENLDLVLYGATEREAKLLETSVDFTSSITTLVFVGLGRSALEVGGPGKAHGGDHLADFAVGCFVICVFGVFFMLYGIIPLQLREEGERTEISNGLLAVAVAGTVIWITWVIMKAWAFLLFFPPLTCLFVGLSAILDSSQGDQQQQQDGNQQMEPGGDQQQQQQQQQQKDGNQQMEPEGDQQQQQPPPGNGETKPAPLELTKTTLTGFLLVGVQSLSDGSSKWTKAFVLLSAGGVVSGLLWRLLTHRTNPPPAVVKATNVASLFAHLCLAAAVIPFAAMAWLGNAL